MCAWQLLRGTHGSVWPTLVLRRAHAKRPLPRTRTRTQGGAHSNQRMPSCSQRIGATAPSPLRWPASLRGSAQCLPCARCCAAGTAPRPPPLRRAGSLAEPSGGPAPDDIREDAKTTSGQLSTAGSSVTGSRRWRAATSICLRAARPSLPAPSLSSSGSLRRMDGLGESCCAVAADEHRETRPGSMGGACLPRPRALCSPRSGAALDIPAHDAWHEPGAAPSGCRAPSMALCAEGVDGGGIDARMRPASCAAHHRGARSASGAGQGFAGDGWAGEEGRARRMMQRRSATSGGTRLSAGDSRARCPLVAHLRNGRFQNVCIGRAESMPVVPLELRRARMRRGRTGWLLVPTHTQR